MPEWLSSHLPEGWTGWHLAAVAVVLTVSTAVGSIVAVGFFLAQLPADYFVNPETRRRVEGRHPVLHVLMAIGRNLLGYVLIVLGIIMSLPGVPGQGVLTTLIGVMLIDFPGKHRMEKWLISRRGVLAGVNKVRAKLGKPPLLTEGNGDQSSVNGDRSSVPKSPN
jgi:hypothetical protein